MRNQGTIAIPWIIWKEYLGTGLRLIKGWGIDEILVVVGNTKVATRYGIEFVKPKEYPKPVRWQQHL